MVDHGRTTRNRRTSARKRGHNRTYWDCRGSHHGRGGRTRSGRGTPRLAQYFPDVLMSNSLLGIPVGQWLAWLLAVPLSLLIAWILVSFSTLCWKLFKRSPDTQIQSHPLRRPIISVLAIVIDALIVYSLGMPLFYRVYYFRILQIIFAISTAWLLARLTDMGYTQVRRSSVRRESQSLLQLAQHANKVVIIIIACR